ATNNNSTSTRVTIDNGGKGGGSQGGGGNGGSQGGNSNGSAGQVLGSVFTAAATSLGGGLGAGQLPNTGLREGFSPWLTVTVLTVFVSAIYWRLAISPKLR